MKPTPLIMLPFATLLLSIALAPIVLRHHWERHYHKLCLALAAIISSYYVFALTPEPVSCTPRSNRELHGCRRLNFMLAILAALIAAPAGWREVIMGSIALAAYLLTPRQIHSANSLLRRSKMWRGFFSAFSAQ